MSVARGNIKTTLVIDGEQAYTQTMQKLRRQQSAIRAEARALTSAYDENTSSVTKLTDKKAILAKQIQQQHAIVNRLQRDMDVEIEKNGEMSDQAEKLATQYNNASAKLNNFESELKDVEKELKEANNSLLQGAEKAKNYGDSLQTAGDKITSAGKSMSIVSAGAAGAMVKAADAAIDYESAFTGVKKTVDATDEEFNALYESILDLSTEIPVTASEIAGVAEIAGQLGIELGENGESLLNFTEVMIALGQATNLSSEEAASALAKFANVTDMAEEDYSRLGSVIVDLGNNYATTEADIVSMATRLASTGTITGLSQSQIMAVATALSSVGIEAEAGGSAVSKMLKMMQLAVETNSDSLKDFASVSNMSVSEFKERWEKDAVAALGAFTEGLNDTERNGKSATAVLADMGITEVRLSNAILALSTSNGILTETTKTANQAWKDNTALQNEVNQRYETLESKLQIVKNTLQEVAIEFGEELMPYIEKGAEYVKNLSKKFSELSDSQKRTVLMMGAAVTAAGPLLLVLGKLTSAGGALISTGAKAAMILAKLKIDDTKLSLQKLAKAMIETKSGAAASVQETEKLAGVMASNAKLAIGMAVIIGLAAALYAGYKSVAYGSKETRESMMKLGDGIAEFKQKVDEADGSIETIKESLNFSEKNTELETQYNDIQSKIIDIAQTASDERRSLTQDEKDELTELFDLLDEVTDAEIEAFTDTQNQIESIITNTDNWTDERAAEYTAKTQTCLDEQLAAIQDNYEQRIIELDNTYKTEEARASEAYQKEVDAANKASEEKIAAAKAEADENLNLISQKLLTNLDANDTLLSEFAEYNHKMLELENQTNENRNAAIESGNQNTLGIELNYFSQRKQINDDFVKSFIDGNEETVGAYLGSVLTMIESGSELDEANAEVVGSILQAYETMPKSSSKSWAETMEAIKAVTDEADLRAKGIEVGNSFTEGLEAGILGGKTKIKAASELTAAVAYNAAKGELKVNSPSKKAIWLTEMFDEGLIEGLENKAKDVESAAQSVSEKILDGTQLEADIPMNIRLAESYASALQSAGAMQQAIYHQSYVNNNNNNSNQTNYYASAASGQKEIVNAIQNLNDNILRLAAREEGISLTKRQAGRIIEKCLKSVNM